MSDNFKIIVDTREKVDFPTYLKEIGIPFTMEALPVGDYKVVTPSGDVTVERKSIVDFIGSLLSGRLEDQARRMAQEKIPMLLITGSIKEYYRYAKSHKFTEDHVYGAIASLITRYGFRSIIWIQSTDDHPHSVGVKITAKILKKISEGKLDHVPDRKIGRVDHPQKEVVKLLLHVPDNVATNLLKKFGTLRALLNATDQELLCIEGMGPTRLQRARSMLDTIHTQDGSLLAICDFCKAPMQVIKSGATWKAICKSHTPPYEKTLTDINWPKA